MKWLPKPSLRTAVGLGAVAAVFMATRPRRGKRRSHSSGNVSADRRDEKARRDQPRPQRERGIATPRHWPARRRSADDDAVATAAHGKDG